MEKSILIDRRTSGISAMVRLQRIIDDGWVLDRCDPSIPEPCADASRVVVAVFKPGPDAAEKFRHLKDRLQAQLADVEKRMSRDGVSAYEFQQLADRRLKLEDEVFSINWSTNYGKE